MIAHGALAVLEREDTDESLVERVRQGDNVAFEDLYRRHSSLAVSVARKILRSPQDAEDAAAEAFTNVLSALRRQVGPREMFRPYLLACVRNTCLQRIRRSKQSCSRDSSMIDVAPMEDDSVVEGAVAAAAFESMPARWQSALWMAEVQHLDPLTIAERLDVNVASAGALVYRARQGFTEAYLAQHLSRSGRPACAALGPKLAQYVRGTAGLMASRQVENHIEECDACSAAITELTDVNASLRTLTGPLTVVAAAGATAAAASGGAATVAASGIGLGWLAKIAALVALSAAPLMVSGESAQPALAEGHVAASVEGRASVELDAQMKRPVRPLADPRTRVVDTATPAAPPASHKTAATPGLPTAATTDLPDPLPDVAPTLPALPALPPVGDLGTAGDSVIGTLGDSLQTLPTIPQVTLPAINTPAIPVLPPITIPAIELLPAITIAAIGPLPAITVPAIVLPAIVLPAITVPAITVPAISLPSVTSLINLPSR